MDEQRTRWWPVLAAFLAGCLAAAQIGKVAAALSVVIAELDMTLVQGGLVVSLFTVTTALFGTLFGIAADRFGHLSMAMGGLVLGAVGALAGSVADAAQTLLMTRVVEGVGFTLAVVSLPPLISRASSAADRPLAMGLWGAFMPGGMALIMVMSPWLLEAFGWRGQWTAVGWLLAGWTLLLGLAFRGDGATRRYEVRTMASIAGAVVRRDALLLFACFGCYSAMYVPLTSFFTTLLVTQQQVPLDVATWMVAPVVAVNILGNLAAGWLVRRGAAPHRLQVLAFAVMAICGTAVFASSSAVAVKVVAGLAFSAFGGLIPGTSFILAPRLAAHPAQIAALSGLLLQGAGIGQSLGPLAVSAAVERFGAWHHANAILIACGALGMLFAWRLGGAARLREKN